MNDATGRVLPGLVLLGVLLAPAAVRAGDVGADVMPRITVGGRLVSTFDLGRAYGRDRDDEDTADVDVADSSLLVRFDKRLFDQSVGGAVLGLEFPDPDADFADTVYYHHVFAFLWDRNYRIELGRTKLRNYLVEFPTLRDDDLLWFTETTNGLSNSNTEEYQQFGNHLAVDLFAPRQFLAGTVYLAQRTETEDDGSVKDGFDVNGGGVQLQRTVPAALKFSGRVRQAGVGWDVQRVDVDGGAWKNAFVAGGVVNLTLDPADHWEAMAQAIYDLGAGDEGLGTLRARALARSVSVVGAVNFRKSTFQLLRWKAGLTGAYKRYTQEGDGEWSVVPTFQYRLGDGVAAVAQYRYTGRSADLARAVGFDREHRVQVGLTFDFEAGFNDYIGQRQSILNLEHGFVR